MEPRIFYCNIISFCVSKGGGGDRPPVGLCDNLPSTWSSAGQLGVLIRAMGIITVIASLDS